MKILLQVKEKHPVRFVFVNKTPPTKVNLHDLVSPSGMAASIKKKKRIIFKRCTSGKEVSVLFVDFKRWKTAELLQDRSEAFDKLKPNQSTSDQFTCGSNDSWLNYIGLMNLGSL